MTAHALLSPSSAHRWLRCPGSVGLEAVCPPSGGSEYTDEGTRAHELAAALLSGGSAFDDADAEMIEHVAAYVNAVRSFAQGSEVLVEQRVDFSGYIGQPDSFGTADVIVLAPDELQIHDLKYGRGVMVDAEENEQLMLYALGALQDFGHLYNYSRARLVIHQPRIDRISEWVVPVDYLQEWSGRVRAVAAEIVAGSDLLDPGERQCRWCRAKATCPALALRVQALTSFDFDNLDEGPAEPERLPGEDLSQRLQAVDLVEAWCKAVREEAYRRLAEGEDVPGFKLVEGRRGARRWASETDAEATLKSMRLKVDEMYDFKLISPTAAEKLHKDGTIGSRQWPRLQNLIVQAEGKPSVAPVSDKRPAVSVAARADEFEALV